jgi:hypothetical protein
MSVLKSVQMKWLLPIRIKIGLCMDLALLRQMKLNGLMLTRLKMAIVTPQLVTALQLL